MRVPSSVRHLIRLACVTSLLIGSPLPAQDRRAEESRREQWQKVDEIFAAMAIRQGAVVADVGAGDGFFTSRLARAVGQGGGVFAVDIDDAALERLRQRLAEDGVQNVSIVKGSTDDPRLPEGVLDAALIINAYHEMSQHQAMLAALRRALKPEGRLVIVEPVDASKRGRPRADEVRDHEIDPEFVLQDARTAGFRVVGLQDPFTVRASSMEWLMTLQPASAPLATTAASGPSEAVPAEDLTDAALRVSVAEFKKLLTARAVTTVDVREPDSFAIGHIPGAISIPLEAVTKSLEQLRRLGKPIVTYCS
jgi:predicted methyltransferase